jgi:hypothetical protein
VLRRIIPEIIAPSRRACRARGQLAILTEHGRQHYGFLGGHGALPGWEQTEIGLIERLGRKPFGRAD